MPFMDEMPMCRYAVSADQPNVAISCDRSPSEALTVSANMSEPPKSNGMIVKMSTFAPRLFASPMISEPGPPVPVPKVRMAVRLGLCCLRSLTALRIRCRTVVLPNSSLFSTSKSTALSWYASMTCW